MFGTKYSYRQLGGKSKGKEKNKKNLDTKSKYGSLGNCQTRNKFFFFKKETWVFKTLSQLISCAIAIPDLYIPDNYHIQ